MTLSVKDVADWVKGEVVGDASAPLSGVNAFDIARPGDLTFAGGRKYLDRIEATAATCVLVPRDFDRPVAKTLIRVGNPKVAFALALSKLHTPPRHTPGIDPTASIAATARLGRDVYVGPRAVIEDGAQIGDACAIEAGAVVGARVRIGGGTVIHANATLYHDITVGACVIIHSGAVIGADGFGYVEHEGVQHKVPQMGTVEIGDGVEIGANATIDRATFGATVIGAGSKIDNLCQIAHNVQMGRNVVMAGQAGVAGSVKIGDNAILAAQAGVRDNIEIGERAIVGAKSGVSNSIPPGQQVFGIPARDIKEARRQIAAMALLTPHAGALARLARKDKG